MTFSYRGFIGDEVVTDETLITQNQLKLQTTAIEIIKSTNAIVIKYTRLRPLALWSSPGDITPIVPSIKI